MLRVGIYGPETLAGSGLSLYADGLQQSLVRSGRVATKRIGWKEDIGRHWRSVDVLVWCGIPADLRDAQRVVNLIVEAPSRLINVLVPEWEARVPDDLYELTRPLERRRLLVVGMNNQNVARTVAQARKEWSVSPVPTPLEDIIHASISSRYPSDHDRPLRAMYLGRDVPTKNLQLLIHAWAISQLASICTLTIYTSMRSSSNGQVEGIRFEVVDENNAMKQRVDWYDNHDIYVSASLFEYGPIAALEAMARGCIPVLANSPGHRDMFRRSNSCLLFDDVDSLVATILELSVCRERLHYVSESGMKYVRSEHGPLRIGDAFLALVALW